MNTQLPTTTQQIDPLALIERAELADTTKAKYRRVVTEFLETGGDLLDAGALGAFADGLSNSRKAHLRAAVKIYTDQLRHMMNTQADPMAGNAQELEARMSQADRRYKALAKAIQVKQPKGRKAHTWLSAKQVKGMFNATNGGIEGERDRAALGLLVAAGLRREEAVTVTFEDLDYLPVRERMRAVLTVRGKGDKTRVVPISDALAGHLDTWGVRVGYTGPIVRSLGRNREPGDGMSAVGLFKLVRRYGEAIGKPKLAAHDLRRTYAQLGYQAGVPVTQISILLGHESIKTTQQYLDLELDKEATASDFVPWG